MKHLRVVDLAFHVVPVDGVPDWARLVVLEQAGQRVRPHGLVMTFLARFRGWPDSHTDQVIIFGSLIVARLT